MNAPCNISQTRTQYAAKETQIYELTQIYEHNRFESLRTGTVLHL